MRDTSSELREKCDEGEQDYPSVQMAVFNRPSFDDVHTCLELYINAVPLRNSAPYHRALFYYIFSPKSNAPTRTWVQSRFSRTCTLFCARAWNASFKISILPVSLNVQLPQVRYLATLGGLSKFDRPRDQVDRSAFRDRQIPWTRVKQAFVVCGSELMMRCSVCTAWQAARS